jgi:protein-tyrosine phosphatase
MVCLGNICRSPIAQGVLEKKIREKKLDWIVDSVGTSGWHDGEAPDDRAIKATKAVGIDISKQISRKITPDDLDYFDVILTMDSSNYLDVINLCKTPLQKDKVSHMLNFLRPGRNEAVPDPYYHDNFAEVVELLDDAMDAFILAKTS